MTWDKQIACWDAAYGDSTALASAVCRASHVALAGKFKPEVVQFCERVGSLLKTKQAFMCFARSKEEKHPVSDKLMENNTCIKVTEACVCSNIDLTIYG